MVYHYSKKRKGGSSDHQIHKDFHEVNLGLIVISRKSLMDSNTTCNHLAAQIDFQLTLRYICPCPVEFPLSNTDWLRVGVVAEVAGPWGRGLVIVPPADVVLRLTWDEQNRKLCF